MITFGSMAAKAVVRDVGRVSGHAYGFVESHLQADPPDPGMTLAQALEAEPKFAGSTQQDEEVKDLIDMARRLEGVVRDGQARRWRGDRAHQITISRRSIADDEGHHPVTQLDKNDVEYAGLVRFDFLGRRPHRHRIGPLA
ncbi:hypothetical protein ACNKHQ_01060 [Shigella flexneri]